MTQSAEYSRFLLSLSTFHYILAFALALRQLKNQTHLTYHLSRIFILIGFLIQSWALIERGLWRGSCPIGNLFEIYQFLTWALILGYGVLGTTFRSSLLGLFCSALAAFLSSFSFVSNAWDDTLGITHESFSQSINPIIELHVSLAILSYGLFALLALICSMYLFQTYGLKHKKYERFFSLLPSLVELERVSHRLLYIASLILGISISLGAYVWQQNPDHVRGIKLFFASIISLTYFSMSITVFLKKLHGNRMALTGIILFILALSVLWPIDANRIVSPQSPEWHKEAISK